MESRMTFIDFCQAHYADIRTLVIVLLIFLGIWVGTR